ncbi:hypothetical protein BGX29_012161 [Mortierella sp. GBA35]|nr:hypothetical protein BGX29_012161 [Mortierella sp. GBA35]KAG0199463.1 hypothetical protein BGX33_011620 [Mortierella sp. NVP41]
MVLIVGAGLGGLMLGALLEKSGVPYTIFERATTVNPLGSAMSIGPLLLPVFQQLGIYDEFLSIEKYITHTAAYREPLVPYKRNDTRPIEEFYVPPEKIHFGRRVLNISEEEGKVAIQTADNNYYEGDIIVGADGAYSAVRQRMYERLKTEGKIPISDNEDLPFSCTCLIVQTKVLDLRSILYSGTHLRISLRV